MFFTFKNSCAYLYLLTYKNKKKHNCDSCPPHWIFFTTISSACRCLVLFSTVNVIYCFIKCLWGEKRLIWCILKRETNHDPSPFLLSIYLEPEILNVDSVMEMIRNLTASHFARNRKDVWINLYVDMTSHTFITNRGLVVPCDTKCLVYFVYQYCFQKHAEAGCTSAFLNLCKVVNFF